MIKILESRTSKEINFMDDECYKIICMVYYDKLTPAEIATKLEIEENEVHDMLDYGYEHLTLIVKCNYTI